MLPCILVALLLSSQLIYNCDANKNSKSKSVTTLINAKWDATPLVLEAAEYLAEENQYHFWSFIDSITSLDKSFIDLETDKDRYDVIIDEARQLLSPAEISLLKLGLSLHIYSPKVEMFHQIALERGLPNCRTVMDINGHLTCKDEDVEKFIEKETEEPVELFDLDHHYPGSENRSSIVILYGAVGTPEFSKLHTILKRHAEEGTIDYVVRHYIQDRAARKLRLSGYGVELQMKSTEYKSQDDSQPAEHVDKDGAADFDEDEEVEGINFKRLVSLYPELTQNLTKFKQHLEEASGQMASLKAWQFQELGLQAAEKVLSAPPEEALSVLTYTAQNFPMQAKSLLHTKVSSSLRAEMKRNSDLFLATINIQQSDTALFVNGLFCDMDMVDMFSIMDIMRSELRAMEGLHRIGITKSVTPLLSLELSPNSGSHQSFALDIRDSAIIWVNDVEKDREYARWSSSLMEMLRPTFPGMLRSVRRNMYNLVLLIDPVSPASRPLLKLAESFIVHQAPLRIGLVFSISADSSEGFSEDDAGVALLCAFNFITEQKNSRDALGFITDIFANNEGDKAITTDNVKEQLKKKFPRVDLEDVIGEDSSYDFGRQLAAEFIQKAGFIDLPQVLLNGVPLSPSQLTSDDFEESVLMEIMQQTPIIQKAIYKGEISDSDNVLDYLMKQPNVMPRLNQRILNTEDVQFLDLTGKAATDITDMSSLIKLNTRDMTATLLENLKYFSRPSKNKRDIHFMTYWIVGDLSDESGRKHLLSGLEFMKSSGSVRLAFLPNANGDKTTDTTLNRAVLAALEVLSPEEATDFVIKLLNTKDSKIGKGDLDIPSNIKAVMAAQENSLKMIRVYNQRVLGFAAGQRGIICDGRIIGPLKDNEELGSEDLSLLERFSSSLYVDKLKEVLKKGEDYEDGKITSNVVMQIVSLLVSRPQGKNRFQMPAVQEDHSVIKIPARDPSQAAVELWAIVDPVSRGAQKLGPILSTLQRVLNCNVKIYLNAVDKHSDMPLKSFFRFVLEPEIQFTASGEQTSGPTARFHHMPTAPLLTQNMQVPDNWLVESVRAVYDLDNIRLQDVDSVVHSEFELENLLLEGHCFDSIGTPPRGLQITLGTQQEPVKVDTIVMANLGYFQLKANPGAWILRLREGRSRDIYDIVSHDGIDVAPNSTGIKSLISSFRSNVVKLRVAKKPGMTHTDLLSEPETNGGLWNSITSSLTGSSAEPEETLNIFSLASGHLYERFLRIMMLSVLKNTKTPVKFWFLKNYLSPALKDFLPYMSKEYGFQYELVEYKWPRWLHQQTEKQRIIWGYKILFLDVLFPLDVKKIIFVDADQIVRADMLELHNLDLGGAPYGYTPFCESRTEMDGFRFWKHGYWRNHLQGRRYHISALYVVDLKRFRRIAAGDRLRGQYQALSQDSNSLANLDQDLPNNMIHQVAIKSLPQEWLWCETWCDDDSKKYAKTIDLCNNPETKEAKLSAAVRIVPEWTQYDNEMKQLQQKIDSGFFDTEETADEDVGRIDSHTEL